MLLRTFIFCVLFIVTKTDAQWHMLDPRDSRDTRPPTPRVDEGKPIKVGEKWPEPNKFRWVVGDLEVPGRIENQESAGRRVGLRVNGGDGGEVWVNGKLQCRFDNDHPGLVLMPERRSAAEKIRVAIQFYGKVQGGEDFAEAKWVLIDDARVRPVVLKVDTGRAGEPVPSGLAGLSQGGGLSDYEDATAKKLKEAGFRWFRMDNIFTGVLKKSEGGNYTYDWADFDKRVDFIVGKMGADAIFAVSYMPQCLDAIKNDDRQSAPKDYKAWEELCYQAAKRAIDRKQRVAYWEVWNEVNTGWLKPGPEDKGNDPYRKMYTQALGHPQTEEEVNRRFEAYCKLYQATARGVLRADPQAKIGGPALASGPFEHDVCDHCFHGQGFARGLMLFCQTEKLPLDFVSWHEYFQTPETFAKEAEAFRAYLKEFPTLEKSVRSLMITEWNEAWWADRPQDHELGAAWAANTLTRAIIPKKIDRPCFFYVKQSDTNFRGDYSLLMGGNVPKASYNVMKIFNHLSGRWLPVKGGDDDVSAVACWDAKESRLAVVMANFRDRYALGRKVQVSLPSLPAPLRKGTWREWRVDPTHSNAWNDMGHAELEMVHSGNVNRGELNWEGDMPANSVIALEVVSGQ